FGCTFCREAVDTVSKKRQQIEAGGSRLAFVHLGTEEKAQWFFKPYGLLDVPRFSDPEGPLYQAFGLLHWEWRQYLNSESILRMATRNVEKPQKHWGKCKSRSCSQYFNTIATHYTGRET